VDSVRVVCAADAAVSALHSNTLRQPPVPQLLRPYGHFSLFERSALEYLDGFQRHSMGVVLSARNCHSAARPLLVADRVSRVDQIAFVDVH